MHYYPTDDDGNISSPSPKHINVAEKAETVTYSQGAVANSLLNVAQLRALNLRDSKNNAALALVRRKIGQACIDQQKAILASARVTGSTKIFYDQQHFPQGQLVTQTCFTEAKLAPSQERARWRHLTKHRTIASFARFHANGFGEIFESGGMAMGVVTHCAPNLMDTSPEDERIFLNGGRLRDPMQYYQIMKLGYQRMMYAAIQLHGTVIITPLFGGGVYLEKLKKDKSRAWDIAHQALIDAYSEMEALCRELQILFTLEELVYCIPDKYEPSRFTATVAQRDPAFISAQSYLQYYQGTAKVTLTNADCIDVAVNAASNGKKPILFNPGSDCIVGGGYLQFINESLSTKNVPPTLEEVYATVSDFIFRQAADNAREYDLQPYPSQLEFDPRKTTSARADVRNGSASVLPTFSSLSSSVRSVTRLGLLPNGVARQLLKNQGEDRQEILDLMQYYFVQYQKLQPLMLQATVQSSTSASTSSSTSSTSTESTVQPAFISRIPIAQKAADAATAAQQSEIIIGVREDYQDKSFYIQYSQAGVVATTIGFSVVAGKALLYLNNMNENDPAQPENKYTLAFTALNEMISHPLFRKHFADALEKYSAPRLTH